MDNSKSLFRDMIQTALDEDLNKTDLQVFLVLLSQTLGFGKASDPLTYGRIAHHMHKRKDHVKKSTRKILATGLFDAAKHKSFDFTYTIGAKFLVKHRGDFFTPTLPKTGENFRKMVAFSENWEHTDIYPYHSLPIHQQPSPQVTCSKATLDHTPQAVGCCGHCDKKHATGVVANTEPETHISDTRKEDLTSIKVLQPHPSEETPALNWEDARLPELPKLIPPQGANKIYTIFKRGTPEQARNALLVFADIQKKELIQSPVGLLRRLAEWSQDGSLTLPNTKSHATEKARDYQQKHVAYSAAHELYNPNPDPTQMSKEKIAREISYLRRIAATSNETIEYMARDADMEYLLPYLDKE
jgi:predicted transcriptional regulator